MSRFLVVVLSLASVNASARDIQLNVDITRHLDKMSNVSLEVTYESRSTAFGCQTYSGDILEPTRPIYIEKGIELNNGVASTVVPLKLSRCEAKLVSVDLYVRLDRKAVARANGVSKSDVDKNRIDFHFNVLDSSQIGLQGRDERTPTLSLLKLYVAGSDELKYTLSCSNEIALIVNDAITLSL